MYKYQIIKLKGKQLPYTALGAYPVYYEPELPTVPDKQYKTIESFMFYTPLPTATQAANHDYYLNLMNDCLIQRFKIGNYEISGDKTPIRCFAWGKASPIDERFTKINVPNNLQKIDCLLSVFKVNPNPFYDELYLILRLTNNEANFDGYHRYETVVFDKILIDQDPIFRFKFKPSINVKRLKGICTCFTELDNAPSLSYPLYNGISLNANTQLNAPGTNDNLVGKLSLQINSMKSLPVLIPVRETLIENSNRKVQFCELNELIETGSNINGYFIFNKSATFSSNYFSIYLTLKYDTN